jgi:hypothetical protein
MAVSPSLLRHPSATPPTPSPRRSDLLADCQRAYLAAPGHLRRQWNQALFERLIVYDERIADAEVAEPFATLADPPSFRSGWMVRPSPEPALLLTAVQ